MTSIINYRSYVKDDVSQILALWENSSDFGSLTPEIFESWFLKTPYENAEIIVAENDHQQLIGQMVFMPTRMIVNGQLIKAMRIAAPILNTNYRFTDAEGHPIFEMFLKGINHARNLGFSLMYIFPARGWLKVIEMYSKLMIKWYTATYNTFSVAIKMSSDDNALGNSDLNFKIVERFTEEYNQLWEKAIINFPIHCGIVRQKEWLSYRLSSHCIVEARHRANHSLQGYFVVKKKSGLLVDMLATSKQELKKLFWCSIEMLASIQPENTLIETGIVTGMYTDLMAFILENKTVTFPNYKFDFGCCVLDDNINPDHINPTHWYMMPDV
ncbi:MAG: GNAT family N-acetyltransferase [Bacteroidia bacterium]|nr:GNAT family N-acetyltransferase [Bacteroidia bacterium]